jgi:NAD(P)-dependent dehydrogenase (short-subunit alcohol dehydrogenase family)
MTLKQTVIVTGAAKGIGEATARLYADRGADVTLLDIDVTAGEIADTFGDQCRFIKCDVSKEEQVEDVFTDIRNRCGQLDVLVNNADIQRYSTVTETSVEEWDHVLDVNLKSAFLCAKHAIPLMLANHEGVIINVASVQSFHSQRSVAPYATSKAALLGLTRSIAVDYAPKIRSIAVCPGTVDTPMLQNAVQDLPNPDAVLTECRAMHLLGRIAEPREIAELIVFLGSKAAPFITGHAIRADGGLGVLLGGH